MTTRNNLPGKPKVFETRVELFISNVSLIDFIIFNLFIGDNNNNNISVYYIIHATLCLFWRVANGSGYCT